MNPNTAPLALDAAQFALRVLASVGQSAYPVYLAQESELADIVNELTDELIAAGLEPCVVTPSSGPELLRSLAKAADKTLLINAARNNVEDWSLLDRRRSELQRRPPTIIVTTPESFDALMRGAPNLASWLGGEVFAHPSQASRLADAKHVRDERLSALRAWANLSDDEVLEQAQAQTLPRDPEYAEWLVLLGRGDLLDG